MAELFCSRHKTFLPTINFTLENNHTPDRCNACIEKDRARREAERVRRVAAINDALHTLSTFNTLRSELERQKEMEHISHTISFNSEKPFDILLSDPGDDNMENLDPATESGKDWFKSEADALAGKIWRLLGYRWR